MSAKAPVLTPEESAALLALPSAITALKDLVAELAKSQQQWFTMDEVARELRFSSRSVVLTMPEVMEEARYPTGANSPRWTREGLARAASRMPSQPNVDRKGLRDVA